MTSSTFVAEARDHEKCAKAGNEAAAFWMWAIQYANKRHTAGFLDEAILFKIPPVPIATKRAKELAERCVGAIIRAGGAGLFERVEGGYQIHDFDDYANSTPQPTSAEVHEQLVAAARREAGKLGASKRWQLPLAKPDGAIGNATGIASSKHEALLVASDPLCHDGSRALSPSGVSGSGSSSALDPLESLTNPDATSHRARGPKRRTALPDGWAPTEVDIAFAASNGWGRDRVAEEAERFTAHHSERHTLSAGWDMSWRTWVLRGLTFDRQAAGRYGARPGPARSVQPAAAELFKPAKVLR
jgi:hypothetical protein